MKKEISPSIIVAAIAVVVLIIGFLAFRTFFQNPYISPNSAAAKKAYADNRARDAAMYQRLGRGGAGRVPGAVGSATQGQQPASGGN